MGSHPNERLPKARRTTLYSVLAVVAAAAVAVTACSSSGGSNNSSSGGTTAASGDGATTTAPASSTGASSASGDDTLNQIKAHIAAISQVKVDGFAKPNAPFNPGVHKAVVIASGLSTPGASTLAPFMQDALHAMGWSAPATEDGKFDPTTQAGLIQQAANDGVDAILLVSITPSNVSSALSFAKSKGIAIACAQCGPLTDSGIDQGIIGVESDPQAIGKAQADYAISKIGGKGTIVVYNDKEFEVINAQATAALAEIKAKCPGCKVISEQMKAGDEQAPGVPVFAAVLDAHPTGTINYVIAPYDNAAAAFAKLAQQKGRNEIGFVSNAALPVIFDLIKAKNPAGAQASVTQPLPYQGWAAVDEVARVVNKKPTWDAQKLPVGLVTQENAADFGNSPYTQPTFDMQSYFKQQWGK